ncbi:MAG: hypothetical protein ACFB2W_27750 [Leptolyngbyaceae cyanobacterium]
MPELTPLSHQQVRCPHCGAIADRYFLDLDQFSHQIAQKCAADDCVTRTVCDHCDYLMVLCTKSDAVLEAYMAGF